MDFSNDHLSNDPGYVPYQAAQPTYKVSTQDVVCTTYARLQVSHKQKLRFASSTKHKLMLLLVCTTIANCDGMRRMVVKHLNTS